MKFPPKNLLPAWVIFVVVGSFLLAVLLVGIVNPHKPESFLTPIYLLTTLLYTLVFAGPILLIGGLVRWLEKI